MFLRKLVIGAFALTLLLSASVVSFGQIGKIAGKVYKTDAEGKPQPVEGAKVVCYRMDTDQSCRSTETEKNGSFMILGVPIGGRFILGVSGPGLEPTFFPETKCGSASENIQIAVSDGDGTEPTEEQLRTSAAAAVTGDLTADQKKAQAEIEKQRLEIMASNKTVEENNALREKLGAEGLAAFNAKDYETAITKFDEGYKLAPTFVGAAPQFLNNLAVAYKQRGVSHYLEEAKSAETKKINDARDVLSADMIASLTAAMEARRILLEAQPADIPNPTNHKDFVARNDAVIKDDFSILAQVNLNLIKYDDPDETKAKVIKIYREAYAAQPANPDVVAWFSLGLYGTYDEALKQESLNIGTKYLKTADEKHRMRDKVEPIMTLLTEEGLKPQPVK